MKIIQYESNQFEPKAFSKEKINNDENKNDSNQLKPKKLNFTKIKIALIFVPIALIAIFLLVYFLHLKKQKKKRNEEINHIPGFETEFRINTKVGDLKRIFVHQFYYEDILSNGNVSRVSVDRKTYYDIYIISELESAYKKFYDKIYEASIVISSQCVSINNGECEPSKLMDLAAINDIDSVDPNKMGDLKDIPLPLCLFNLTDNNVITSMTCPETLPDTTQNTIILDLYFFRPPAIKRIYKSEYLKIIEDKENNKKYIREKNDGICDIYNPINSHCTTEMNTTTDFDDNIISYDEIAFTNITSDTDNSYIKNKTTNLIDVSDKYSFLNPEKYHKILKMFLAKLNPYMKYTEHFSLNDFDELLSISKASPKKKGRRYLNNENQDIINEQAIFNYTYNQAIEIQIDLKNNLGYNSEAMEALISGKIDENKKALSNLKIYGGDNITKIINKLITLSNAGNNMVRQLMLSVETNYFDIIQNIKRNISSINNQIVYKNISEVFDPRLYLKYSSILPIQLLFDSNYLKDKLEKILVGIKNGNLKQNINILNKNIYNYIRESHILINNIFNNIKDLGEALDSKKSKSTEISTYYSEHSTTSFSKIISIAENILMNYYKKENETINNKIEPLFKSFENKIFQSLAKEINSIDEIYEGLLNKNMSMENATNENITTFLNNLKDINNYISNITNEIKYKLGKEIDIKDSNYTISKNDIESNLKTYSQYLEKANIIANKLDNDEFIDKKYDEIMIKFREKFSEIQKYMNDKIYEYFPLNEEDNNFIEKENIKDQLKNLRYKIVDHVKKENNDYFNLTISEIEDFLSENKEYLEQLINNVTILFSDISKFSELYEIAFNNCLIRLEEEIQKNNNLTTNYFSNLQTMFNDDLKIYELIETLNPMEKHLIGVPMEYHACYRYGTCYSYLSNISDLITSKNKTTAYLKKYAIFKNKFSSLIEYYKSSQFFRDLLDKYKNVIIDTKRALKSIKDNSIFFDEYKNFSQFIFIKDNIKDIDELYIKVNNYLSDEIFNEKYIQRIEDFKSEQIYKLENITQYIDEQHKIINSKKTNNDNKNDFFFSYNRKRTYTCTNGVVSTKEESSPNCLPLSEYSNNCDKILLPSIDNDAKINKFINEFSQFNSSLNEMANIYNSKISELKNKILSSEKKILNEKNESNYLSSIQNEIDQILKYKYESELIKTTYNYYQNLTEKNSEVIFNDISNQWNTAFDDLQTDIDENFDDFKHSSFSFGMMALLYENIFTKNISKNYFDTIEVIQKNEFNYSIAYSYNFLYKEINSTYNYIINEIPQNEGVFNNIIIKRKKEINNVFNKLFEKIRRSKAGALSMINQNDILQVSSSNFFNLTSKLFKFISETSESLKSKGLNIYMNDNGKLDDEYSLTCKYYLENIESGKQINIIYGEVDQNFIELYTQYFKKLLEENIKFEQSKFTNDINTEIYNSNQRILELYSELNKDIENILENEIKRLFTKESFYKYIDDLYEHEIKNLDDDKKQEINLIIKKILNNVKAKLLSESNRIISTATSYNNNFSRINITIKKIEEEIFDKIKYALYRDIEELNINLTENIYKIIQIKLDDYLNRAKSYKDNFSQEYKLIDYSFNVGEIIYQKVGNLVKKYKDLSRNIIDILKEEYLSKISIAIKLDSIENLIAKEIENEYNSNLLASLNSSAKIENEETYDLNEEIKKNISLAINKTIEELNVVMISLKDKEKVQNLISLNEDYENVPFVFIDIKNKFEYFFSPLISNQKNEINSCIINLIESNFINILENIIFSFGNDLFDRIIKYNQNYKIKNLYKNLKYSLIITLQYYISIYQMREVDALTKDLKLKLFNLNDLEIRADKENNNILELLNEKISYFIKESKKDIIDNYINNIKENEKLKDLSSNDIEIKAKIGSDFEIAKSNINEKYDSLINKTFKEKFIESYTKIMKDETKEMIDLVNTQKENIKSLIEDFLTLNSENILNDINDKINKTTLAIEDFNKHITQFNISDELIEFLNNYGTNKIQPLYAEFTKSISKAAKDKVINYLSIYSLEFENSYNNLNDIMNTINKAYSQINNSFTNINNSINSYHGIEEYPTYLENEISRIDKRRRRLNDQQIENDILEEYKERFPDSSLDEHFRKILKTAEEAKKDVDTFEKFEEFETMISSNIKNLNISYLSSKQSIENNFEIVSQMLEKLEYLRNISFSYYNNINESFHKFRNYINKSVYEFNNLLRKCANITYYTFANKYEKISNETTSIYNEVYDDSQYEVSMQNDSIYQNNKYITNMVFKSLIKEAIFSFKLIFEEEEGIKKPKVIASIINRSRPKNVVITIDSNVYDCEKTVKEIEINFNNINYTSYIEFNTNSTNIYLKIIADFEAFSYSTQKKQILRTKDKICLPKLDDLSEPVCYPNKKCDITKILENLKRFPQNRINFNKNITIY